MQFQIYDYVEDHEKLDGSDSDSEENSNELPKYIIHVFGRTMDDKSVYCKVRNFTPHFYIRLPSSWRKGEAKTKLTLMEKWLKSFENKKVWKKFREGLLSIDLVSRKEAIGFTNEKEYLFARLIFNNSYAMKKYRYMIEQNKIFIPRVTNKEYQFKTYEANILPMLRCFHIRKVSGCSWVEVKKYEEITFEAEKDSHCDIELIIDWKDIEPIEKDCNAPLRIASFDIECTSIDGQFPMARRKSDGVIQIGTAYTKLGESVPYRQHIVCLDETEPVEGAVTEWYSDERDLILAWKKEIIHSDCDILTGYNIFFFDEKYIYDRCDIHLGLKIEISMLSKLKNVECNFRDFKLASSAMGENMIRYWDTPGRVHVDLMKDVQKTYNLSSYKLDSVASNFIRGRIEKIDSIKNKNLTKYTIHCANVEDINDNDYIHIEHVKSFVSDFIGNKYFVDKVDVENKTLTFTTDIIIEDVEEGSLFWSQAKDDVGPQDIFRLQKGNSADRSIVAKYCVKDCRLVNVLVNKLEVVTKNIEMANVCYVPFSYLFVRGQGVKLFSLALKAYRDDGFLFPVLSKPKEDDGGYEGAIVFDPVPNVYYDAEVTKDYASLYPSSILQKNMSHETIVRSSEYDEIEGIEYYNAQYKQSDGTIKNVRFAKKDGSLGVVPKILDTLLKERKAIKKLMKAEKNPFKYKILDAKQLALKVTANSLYGQLGAPTSQIYMKSIAACTTSTGREMLIFAKKYDEEILPGFLNGLKYAYMKEDYDMVEKFLDLEFKDRENTQIIDKIKEYVTNKLNGIIFNPVIRYGDTDSVFTCFRFREESEKLKKKKGLKVFKSIVEFSKTLIMYFLPEEHHQIYENIFEEYYSSDKIEKLELPKSPNVLPEPEHWNVLLPIDERIKQFIKEYMEESYFPWLWTLQEIFNDFREKFTDKQFNEIIIAKLYNFGEHLVEKIKITPYNIDLTNEIIDEMEPEEKQKIKDEKMRKKLDFEETLTDFFKNEIEKIWIEPYWYITKSGVKKTKINLWKKGKMLTDKRTLELSIEMGEISGETVKKRLPFPHDLEYEKTFWPFLILTKKRYVGNKFELDPEKFKQDFMGIVLKRRDNSPIVKEVCNGIIDALINFKDPKKAKKFTKKCLKDMFNNKFDINYFLTSKTLKLKESYKDWTRIAHVVLAERIGLRDPGNKPQSGDRITFAAIKVPDKSKDSLQGDMIETPNFIKEQGLELDYLFYMTNQIMKPALQFLELVSKDAEDIFNIYIYKDKINELIKEKLTITKFIAENNNEEYIEDMAGGNNFNQMTIDELKEEIDIFKKDIRKLKCVQRKIIKQNLEKEVSKKILNT